MFLFLFGCRCVRFDFNVIQSNESEKRTPNNNNKNHDDNIVWSRIAFTFAFVWVFSVRIPCSIIAYTVKTENGFFVRRFSFLYMLEWRFCFLTVGRYFFFYFFGVLVVYIMYKFVQKTQMHCMYPWYFGSVFFFSFFCNHLPLLPPRVIFNGFGFNRATLCMLFFYIVEWL